jgi:hypothetical protein
LYAMKRVLKVIEDVWSVDREPPYFLYVAKRVLKVIEEDVWSVDREPPCFLYAVKHMLKVIRRCVERRSGAPLLFVRGATRVKSISFLLSKGPSIGSPLLFIRGDMRIKSLSFY